MTTATMSRRVSRGVSAPRLRRSSILLRTVIAAGFFAVLLMWWLSAATIGQSSPAQWATTLGELSGMAGGYLVCAQVLLITRIPWFERAVGLDKLVSWHRTLGTTVVLLIVAHVALMLLGAELLDAQTPWGEVFVFLDSYPDMLTALIGTAAFLAVGLSSARLLRKRLSYEAWYWLHLTTYVAIFLTFLHQISAGVHFVDNPVNKVAWLMLYLGTASAVLTWRFVLPSLDAWRHRLRVEGVVLESPGTASVWFSGKHLDELGVRAGNFMLFRFMQWGHLLTAHPYSVSWVPNGGMMRITVGALGDHSRLVQDIRPGTLVFAEGPFGTFTADRASLRRILLIAGGAGIGPIRALAEDLTARGLDVVLLYRAHAADQLALLTELQSMPRLKVIAQPGRRRELGFDPLEARRIASVVPDIAQREVFICGPEGMAQQAEDSLRQLRVPRRFIHREELSMS
jgi:predicted ferric reductase